MSARAMAGPKPGIEVVAAILADTQGRVLVTQRPAGKALAGYWEFPGGKLEPGEVAEAALRRELAEELGVQAGRCRAWMSLEHAYPERHVRLAVWRVDDWQGTPVGREGQALQWLAPAALAAVGLLPADLPIAARLVADAH
jgi:8-oxo-dGTP diphosphatase